jgi:ketosteroid isomerase-like protein
MKTYSTKAMSITDELRETIEAVIARWRDAVAEKNLQALGWQSVAPPR